MADVSRPEPAGVPEPRRPPPSPPSGRDAEPDSATAPDLIAAPDTAAPTTPPSPPLLEITDLSAGYGPVRVLHNITLTVPEHGITAVLGANGAGKTTLLRTVSGLIRPASGTVALAGRLLNRRSVEDVARLGVAHVPEGRGVILELTVEENLRLGRRRDTRDRSALSAVYDLFPSLAARRSRPGSTLSGGERQMLAIGRALLAEPRLLMLDEPSLGLAPRVVARLMAVLADLRARTGLTVLLVEQNARSALSVADRVVVLSLGAVAVDGDAAAFASDDRLRHAYLGF
ncbi:MAG: ABC transporter ATP-binding protein [Catenulispora sp.]|nr:ABC transporter ATP-binding protein [Catenulispora sp.]